MIHPRNIKLDSWPTRFVEGTLKQCIRGGYFVIRHGFDGCNHLLLREAIIKTLKDQKVGKINRLRSRRSLQKSSHGAENVRKLQLIVTFYQTVSCRVATGYRINVTCEIRSALRVWLFLSRLRTNFVIVLS
jgi:hypothetical protein